MRSPAITPEDRRALERHAGQLNPETAAHWIHRLLAALDAADALMATGARLDIWATTVHVRGADVQFNDMENLGRAIEAWRAALAAYRAIGAPASAERSGAAPASSNDGGAPPAAGSRPRES